MSEKLPEKMVRVEYDLPPLRAIMSTWYEDFADATDDDYRNAVIEKHPNARIRAIHRGIAPETLAAKYVKEPPHVAQ